MVDDVTGCACRRWSCVSDDAVAGTLTVGVGRGGSGFAEVMNDNMIQVQKYGKVQGGTSAGF